MNKIQILDCTLRDGGYCNQWNFGYDNICKITQKLSQAGIDVIECGFLTNKIVYNRDVTKYSTIEEFTGIIPKGSDKSFVAMVNFGEYDIDMTKNQFDVDSVCFKNTNYFSFPLYGKIEHKVTKIKSQEGTKYPKFTTTTERYEIKQIFDNVDYSGGFSQVGASMHGSSSEGNPAELSIYRNDTLFVTARSNSFRLLPDRVDGLSTEIAITLDDKQITHPGLRFRYLDDKKEMHLVRGGDGLERSMYFDYYHMMTLDVEFIRWKVGSSTMEMKMVAGAAKGYADFSSMDFFKKQYYRELQGMDFEHPFQLIYDYYRMIGGQPFTTEDYVSFRNLPITQLRQECHLKDL